MANDRCSGTYDATSEPLPHGSGLLIRLAGALAAMLFAAGCEGDLIIRTPRAVLLGSGPVEAGLAVEAPLPNPTRPQFLFISGHSLVDLPLPEQIAAIATRAGSPLRWSRKYLVGSSIRERSPASMPGGPHDALLITEQHGLLGTLMWNDTLRHLLDWHEAARAADPAATTYFFVPWLSIDDLDDPSRWMAYEKAAAPVWQCLLTRLNAGIASTGGKDRIVTLPASLALVFLVARLQGGAKIPGVNGTTQRDSLSAVLSDDVHLTQLGHFYMALVTWLGLSGMDPSALAPLLTEPVVPGITPDQTRFLLEVAAGFYLTRSAGAGALDTDACRRYLDESFAEDYWRYARKGLIRQMGWLRGSWSAWRSQRQFEDWVRVNW